MKVVVVGAGIFGLTAALELRRRGHHTIVCDPGPIPHPQAESTDISKVVRMDYADDFYLELMDATFAGWQRWNEAWGEELYHEVGFLLLTRGEMNPGSFEHSSWTALRKRGRNLAALSADEIQRRFPAWTPGGYRSGYFNPRAGWVESGRVVARLALDARAAGVALLEGTSIVAIEDDGARVHGVATSRGDVLSADLVVVAAGSWTSLLVPQLEDRMWATAQTVLHLRTGDPSRYQPPHFPVWAAGIAADGWYGFPALDDGTIKIANHGPGRPLHPNGERMVDDADEARFRDFLRGSLPELAEAPTIERRLCLYSDTFDGDFFIDRDPERDGLVVATGGSGHAFKFAPALGAIIADVVERKPNRYAERFRWRAAGGGSAKRK